MPHHPQFEKNSPSHSGINHWWMQRLSSVLIVPLALWFCWALTGLGDWRLATLSQWMQSPSTVVLLIAFLTVAAYHAVLGLRVVVEDYVHLTWLKLAALAFINVFISAAALIGVLSVLTVFFRA